MCRLHANQVPFCVRSLCICRSPGPIRRIPKDDAFVILAHGGYSFNFGGGAWMTRVMVYSLMTSRWSKHTSWVSFIYENYDNTYSIRCRVQWSACPLLVLIIIINFAGLRTFMVCLDCKQEVRNHITSRLFSWFSSPCHGRQGLFGVGMVGGEWMENQGEGPRAASYTLGGDRSSGHFQMV